MALCHSEQSEESNHINVSQILHFIQDDKLELFTNPSSLFYFETDYGCEFTEL